MYVVHDMRRGLTRLTHLLFSSPLSRGVLGLSGPGAQDGLIAFLGALRPLPFGLLVT
jgi:hypothetical protein